jgi:hypothetical protein
VLASGIARAAWQVEHVDVPAVLAQGHLRAEDTVEAYASAVVENVADLSAAAVTGYSHRKSVEA